MRNRKVHDGPAVAATRSTASIPALALWERLVDSGWTPTRSEEQKAQLDRRLNDLDVHPESALSWEQVEKRLKLPS
jgi:putative addiction module component (TIGR02574 family)